ncbi:MAG TPA: ribosome-associated translation inhibitor RaiA [Clostridiaceae bacterium]|nr:ribosome-associated translation inhibitor RaiA [Clostridiaceae bacterium]
MVLNIHGVGMKIGEQFQEKVKSKMNKFHRFFGDEAVANIRFQHEHDEIRTEVTIKVRSHYYRAEATAPEGIMALERAIDILEGQIRKHKTRMKKQSRKFSYMKEYLADLESRVEPEEVEEMPIIVRRKSFEITPMDANEAVLQMELLNHSFHIFINPDTGKVNLVYKRLDGNYGLIEPEY